MAEKSSIMQTPFWLLLIGLLLVEWAVVFLFVPPETVARAIHNEQLLYANHLGERAEHDIRASADDLFTKVAIDTGLRAATYDFFYGRFEEAEEVSTIRIDDRGVSAWMMRALQSTWGVAYLFLYRLASMAAWVPFMLPVLVPLIYDGVSQWQVRQYQFSYASQTIHGYASKTAGALLAIAFVVISMPFSVTPWVAPAMLVVAGFCGSLMAANMAKRF